jgi:hypothetical protein
VFEAALSGLRTFLSKRKILSEKKKYKTRAQNLRQNPVVCGQEHSKKRANKSWDHNSRVQTDEKKEGGGEEEEVGGLKEGKGRKGGGKGKNTEA